MHGIRASSNVVAEVVALFPQLRHTENVDCEAHRANRSVDWAAAGDDNEDASETWVNEGISINNTHERCAPHHKAKRVAASCASSWRNTWRKRGTKGVSCSPSYFSSPQPPAEHSTLSLDRSCSKCGVEYVRRLLTSPRNRLQADQPKVLYADQGQTSASASDLAFASSML
jgi:hypothetical protein